MKKKTRGGVYQIRYLKSGRRYIGQTHDFKARWRTHKQSFKTGKQAAELQAAYDADGIGAFVFEVLHYEDDEAKRVALEAEEIAEAIHPFNVVQPSGKLPERYKMPNPKEPECSERVERWWREEGRFSGL